MTKTITELQKENADLVASNLERAKALATMLGREKEFRATIKELLEALKPLVEIFNHVSKHWKVVVGDTLDEVSGMSHLLGEAEIPLRNAQEAIIKHSTDTGESEGK